MLLSIAVLAFVLMCIFSHLILEMYFNEREAVALRIKSLEASGEGEGKVVAEEMSTSFTTRIITPFIDGLTSSLSLLIPSSWIGIVERKIVLANGCYGLSGVQFISLCGTFGLLLAIVLGTLLVMKNYPINRIIGFMLLALILGILVPSILLEQKIKTRKTNLQQQLPDVLDVLTVSVEAGLGFDGALAKLSEKMRGEIVNEFTRMLQEVRVGVTRRAALLALAERCDVQDVTLFTSALVQADQLGVGIGSVLRIQSEVMREKRRQRAEEQAMKAPIKMLFPLVFFIFPTIFIVLLGPAMIQIIAMFSKK